MEATGLLLLLLCPASSISSGPRRHSGRLHGGTNRRHVMVINGEVAGGIHGENSTLVSVGDKIVLTELSSQIYEGYKKYSNR